MRWTPGNVTWLITYLCMLAGVAISLLRTRDDMVAKLDTPEAKQDWEEWREDVRRENESNGPVQRRVPKSTEPPTLVLLRDYFPVCMAASLFFSSALFMVTMFAARGVFSSPGPHLDE